ncbi:ATP-binding protein [Tenuifilum thalassicum]|uniref:histidine kinase n=1 Tax=Tenuifilum thalassicum TaxID=2590900 RepID=A0A7D4BBD7_9BACT|nr:ATP-binding protein [Tenuifilum thalassicum]QKG79960.1 PAS domain S-box protein [Tenuifilum thalassicum]
MQNNVFFGILENAALLICVAVLYDFLWLKLDKKRKLLPQIVIGIFLIGIAIMLMRNPWVYVNDIQFDTRSVMLTISGLFFGGITTLVALFGTALYRIQLGGDGMYMGVAVIVLSALIGLAWRKIRPQIIEKKRIGEIFIVALIVHIIMLCCTILLPKDFRLGTLKTIWWAVLLIYPLTTALIAKLLFNRDENWEFREKLSESEKKYRLLFDENPTPMWIYDLETLRFLEVNNAAIEEYGYSKEEFLSMTLRDIRPADEVPKLLDNIKSNNEQFQKSGVWKHLTKDGNLKHVTISSHETTYKGRPARHVMVSDVTELIRINQELAHLEERYRNYIELSNEAICLFELEQPIDITKDVDSQIDDIYKYSYVGECNQTFCDNHNIKSPEEAKGMRLGQIFPRLSKVNIEHLRQFIINGYKIHGVETKEITKHSEIKHFINSWSGIIENDRFLRMWNSKQDITRVKEAEDEVRKLNAELEKRVVERTKQLERAVKELEAFSYSISHDLRAPLRAINGFTEILVEDHSNNLDDEGKRICNVIKTNATQMNQLIEELLRFSRASRANLTHSTIDTSKLIESILNEIYINNPNYKKAQITFNNLPNYYADPVLMKQVWYNLLDNAIKFSGKNANPEVIITCIKGVDLLTFCISDNGVGFDMRYYNKLFGVFQRLHTESEFPGTGAGLAIVKRIIERHGGTIWAESELGKGTKFFFTVPQNATNQNENPTSSSND